MHSPAHMSYLAVTNPENLTRRETATVFHQVCGNTINTHPNKENKERKDWRKKYIKRGDCTQQGKHHYCMTQVINIDSF